MELYEKIVGTAFKNFFFEYPNSKRFIEEVREEILDKKLRAMEELQQEADRKAKEIRKKEKAAKKAEKRASKK